MVIGYKGEQVKDFIRSSKFNLQFTYLHQEEQKGTANALLQAQEFAGDDNFLVLGGDNLFSVQDLQSIMKEDEFNYVVSKEVDNPEKYGVFVSENGFVKKVVEKPQEFVSNTINIGLYKFTKEIWTALDGIELSPRGEYELTDALQKLADQHKLKILPMADYWLDLGCLEDVGPISLFLGSI